MRRTGIILLAAGVLGCANAHSQDINTLRIRVDSAARGLSATPPRQLPVAWLKEAVDPIRQERLQLRRAMERQARQSVVQLPQAPTPYDPNKEIGLWRWSVGNTGVRNWSPYPDRALDARTISLPLPRGMKP